MDYHLRELAFALLVQENLPSGASTFTLCFLGRALLGRRKASQISLFFSRQVRPGLHIGVNRVLGLLSIVSVQQSLDAGSIVRVDIREVLDRFLLDEKLRVLQVACDILAQAFPLLFVQHLGIERPHLLTSHRGKEQNNWFKVGGWRGHAPK